MQLMLIQVFPEIFMHICMQGRNWGGGVVNIHTLLFCPTSFTSHQIQVSQIEKKSVGYDMNIRIYTPPSQLTF